MFDFVLDVAANIAAHVVEQDAGTGHEIGNGGIERVDVVVRTGVTPHWRAAVSCVSLQSKNS